MQAEEYYKELRSYGYNVAENYSQRARTIIEILLDGAKVFTPSAKWKDPPEELIQKTINNFHYILNWVLKDSGKKYYLPLTEEEMTEIEGNLAANLETIAYLTAMLLTDEKCKE